VADDAQNAEGVEDPTAGLKAKNQELLGEVKKLKSELRSFAGLDLDRVNAALEFQAEHERKQAEAKGEFEKAKAKLEQDMAKRIEKATARERKLESVLTQRMAHGALAEAIRRQGGDPDYVLHHGLPFVKVKETDTDFEVAVVTPDGEQGGVEALDALAKQLREKYPKAFDGSGSSGSGAFNLGTPAPKSGPTTTDPYELGRMADAELRRRKAAQR
jgi:hypothetical protein